MTITSNAYRSINRFAATIAGTALALCLTTGEIRSVSAFAQAASQDAGNSQPSPETLLADARRLYDQADQAGASAILDRAIAAMLPRQSDRTIQPMLILAYELRARTRFGLADRAQSRADMEALLRLDAQHRLPGDVSPRVVALFEETRHAVVGGIDLTITPSDADVEIDGTRVPTGTTKIAVAAGDHTLTARRAGYNPVSRPVTIVAGPEQPLTVALERTSASLAFVTVPPDVEIMVDGVARGVTGVSDTPAESEDLARRYQLPADKISRKFRIADLAIGTHTLEFRRACHVPVTRRVSIDRLDDLALEPVKLEPAVGSLRISASATAATVFIDNAPRGAAPVVLAECEGPHTVEVRTAGGRFVRRIEVRTGDQLSIEGTIRPAFAITSVSGLPDGSRGGDEIRLAIERALADSRNVMLFAPAQEQAQRALQIDNLPAGWLAFSRSGQPIGAAAEALTPTDRRTISTRIVRALDVQGIATVTVGSDRNTFLVSLLAPGSSEPDVIELQPAVPESASHAIAQLDAALPLFATSIGVLAVDVAGVPGPVVAKVDKTGAASAALVPGDIILAANGRPVGSARALEDALQALPAGSSLSLDVRTPSGAPKKADIRPTQAARVLAFTDQTVLFNPLLAVLRQRLVNAPATDEPALRLNLAVALMRLGAWQDARAELERVHLPAGSGVGDGTAQYLLGLCFEALGQFGDAERAWTSARSSEALLTADGPPVKGLAEERLAALGRSRAGKLP